MDRIAVHEPKLRSKVLFRENFIQMGRATPPAVNHDRKTINPAPPEVVLLPMKYRSVRIEPNRAVAYEIEGPLSEVQSSNSIDIFDISGPFFGCMPPTANHEGLNYPVNHGVEPAVDLSTAKIKCTLRLPRVIRR